MISIRDLFRRQEPMKALSPRRDLKSLAAEVASRLNGAAGWRVSSGCGVVSSSTGEQRQPTSASEAWNASIARVGRGFGLS